MREEMLYMLRLWRDGPKVEDWRASLKEMKSKEVRYFGNLEALVSHLAGGNFQEAEGKEGEEGS